MKTLQYFAAKFSAPLLRIAGVVTSGLLLLPASAHAQGGVPLWTNFYNGAGGVVAVDNSGNVLVTGGAGATIKYSNEGIPLWTNISSGAANLATDTSGNVFVAGGGSTVKYSSSGVPLWTNLFGQYVALDNGGNVFVTGSLTYDKSATIKYSNDGVPLWTNDVGGGSIGVDSSGSVFVSAGSVTIAYSNEGAPLWTNYCQRLLFGSSFTVDSSGNVFVTGTGDTGHRDYATVAYSTGGVPLWTNGYDGPAGQADEANAIAVDANGNVFVTGSSVTVQDFFSDPPDYATIKYSSSGVPQWTNWYDGPANGWDIAYAIAVDSGGNVFVRGVSDDDDIVTIGYSNAGDVLWENHYTAPRASVVEPHAIAVDRTGNVFVTGRSWNGTDYTGLTIKYSSSLSPPVNLDFQLLNNQLVLSWTNAAFSLQSAPTATGPFATLPAAGRPYTNALTGPQQFFRLKGN